MANTDAPRGFEPRRYSDGRPYNNAIERYPIASAYATSIYKGDAVKLVSGKLAKAAATDQILGIFHGVKFITAAGRLGDGPIWTASTATYNSVDADAEVIVDPNVLFVAQFTNSASIPVVADFGAYFYHYDAGGNTMWGLSGEGIDYTTKTATSTSGVWRFVDFERQPDNDTTVAYSRGLFMPTKHDRRVNSGAT